VAMSDPAPEKEAGTPPSDEKEAGPPATTETTEPEKKKREYKDFGHETEAPTRKPILSSVASRS
jgi:H+-transporting ATPase